MNIVILSYKAFIPNTQNGYQRENDNSVLLLQTNPNQPQRPHPTIPNTGMYSEDETKLDVEGLWAELLPEIEKMDKIVFYYGHDGAEKSIELALAHGIPAEKIVAVCCPCNYDNKEKFLKSSGYEKSEIILCDCGGKGALRSIFRNVLKEGVLRSDDRTSKQKPPRLFS